MILLFVANTVSFLIEGVVLFLGDWYLLASAANVDKVSLLIFIVLHDKTSDFRVVPEPEVSWKKSVEGRPEREINPFQLPTTLVGWCLFTCDCYDRSSHSACRVSVHSGEPFYALLRALTVI